MIINLLLDANAAAAPAAIKNAWNIAANMYASMFTDNITVNLNVHYTGTGGGAHAGPDNGQFESYSSVYNYLTSHASPGDSTFAALPNASSIGGQSQVLVWNAQLKLMGLISPNDTTTDDGSATFATDISASLMVGVALHEFGHALGRVPVGPQPDIMDFNRFTSQGNFLFQSGNSAPPAYFSLNGGVTKWFDWGRNSDPSDFLNPPTSPLSPNDPYNEFYNSNTLQYLTPADLEEMDALGFHLKRDAPAANAYDYNGGNSGDILLQSASGQIEYANMAGGSFQGMVQVASTPGWIVAGAGKIAGNVDSDIVIQNNSTGEIFYRDMLPGGASHWVDVTGAAGYAVVGVGDINDDHYADIVIQNHSDGTILFANMANGVFNGWKALTSTPGWNVVGVADVNDDGYGDVLIQNQSDGTIFYGNMAGGVFNNWVPMTGSTFPGWKAVGAGDIMRNGYASEVIQESDGSIVYANMTGGVFHNWVNVGATPGWNVIAVEDILGNGYDDIIIQNTTTGDIDYGDMTGGSFQHWVPVTTASGFTGHTGPGVSDPGGAVSMQEPGPSAAGTAAAPDPGTANNGAAASVAMFDHAGGTAGGVSRSEFAAVNSGAVPGITVQDPGSWVAIQNAGSSTGGAASAVMMFDPGPVGGDIGHSASWLTDRALPGGTSINNGDQNTANGAAPVVTADNLTHLLKLGT
jgi:hypothetical protein